MARLASARSLTSRLWRRIRQRPTTGQASDDTAPVIGNVDPRTLPDGGTIVFRCNLCGTKARAPLAGLARETPSCPRCGSTVRFRAIAHLIVRELTGSDTPLPDLAPRRDLAGIGLSDAACYAETLARAFAYRNTFFHAAPRLDITSIEPGLRGRHDFVIASDVFEHVAPPVARAFDNALTLLKPGGVFVMTVPFGLAPDTVEHYPDLNDWSVEETEGAWNVVNRTADGRVQRFASPVFHGGPGTTLEMRLFSRDALLREFVRAGFASARIADEPYLPFGIHWPEPWSVPIVARAP
ncbi:MAG: class I SAM-dependent methyltransferase [Betaproteobacteria bacterium]